MKTAIVTGATSFIGIALIKELIREEYKVTAVVRPGSPREYLLYKECPEVDLVRCEISDIKHLKDHMYTSYKKEYFGFDEFYHVAWSSNFDNPRYNLEGQMKNVGYTMDAIKIAAEFGCRKFLGIGSQAECGIVDKSINSRTEDNPITAYALAKCETYCRCCELSDEIDIDFYWPRLLSAYGPYDRPGTLVMSCIDACINHKNIALSKAEQIWDYVYVDDVAKAIKLIIRNGKPKKKYTIASGIGKPLKEYIQDIADVYECPELMKGIGKRPYEDNEVMYLLGDVSEIMEDTGMVFNVDFKKHLPIPFG